MPHQSNIRVKCPNLGCRRLLSVPIQGRGQMVRCLHCGTQLRVPSKQTMARGAVRPVS